MSIQTGSNASRRLLPDQVRDALLARIHDEILPVGAQIPSEPELCEEFGVSRATIREAVRSLVEAGYLTRVQGSGTFVSFRPQRRHTLERNLSYSQLIEQAGFRPGRQVLGLERGPLDEEAANALGAGAGEEAVHIERVRSADDRPVMYSIDIIPSGLVLGVQDRQFEGSLYELFGSMGHEVAHGEATLAPVLAKGSLPGSLGIEPGSPLLMIRQVDYTTSGVAIMFSQEWHVPGVFELSLLRRAT